MLIVIDKRIPVEAKKRLRFFGKVVEFATQNITYPAISGHPDIFLCQTSKSLICAPNLPEKYSAVFKKEGVNFEFGQNPIGAKFPKTSFYNCLISENYLFHKKNHSDNRILEHCKSHKFIDVPQAYTRCSLISLPSGDFISSDKGIESVLKKHKLNVHYFSPEKIILPEMEHGFIGGALGFYSGKLFVIGNPDFHSWGVKFKNLLEQKEIEMISLYDGPFYDGGGIFFLE